MITLLLNLLSYGGCSLGTVGFVHCGVLSWYVHEGMIQALVLIVLPRQKDSFRESSITYEGEAANTQDGAMEKAAQVALQCFIFYISCLSFICDGGFSETISLSWQSN